MYRRPRPALPQTNTAEPVEGSLLSAARGAGGRALSVTWQRPLAPTPGVAGQADLRQTAYVIWCARPHHQHVSQALLAF